MQSASHLFAAIQIVVVADIVMSLDNVIATDPAIEPKLAALFAGPFGTRLDSLLASLNIAHGHSFEFVLAVLGVIIVLVVGGIWRKRALATMAHPEKAI